MLAKIFETKHAEVAKSELEIPLIQMKSMANDSAPAIPFRSALIAGSRLGLIAEVKKASPSEGIIREDFDPVEIARIYKSSGAEALSVLTDETYFGGRLEFLKDCKRATSLPILRKDFIDSEYQIYEARAFGADAVLLIVAWLEPCMLKKLLDVTEELGMDALVEVHCEKELDIAKMSGANLIGINNRNLSNFTIELGVSEELLKEIPPNIVSVSESGLNSHEDVLRVQKAGANAVLIGTRFCRDDDIGNAIQEVMRR